MTGNDPEWDDVTKNPTIDRPTEDLVEQARISVAADLKAHGSTDLMDVVLALAARLERAEAALNEATPAQANFREAGDKATVLVPPSLYLKWYALCGGEGGGDDAE